MSRFVVKAGRGGIQNLVDSDRTQDSVVDVINASPCSAFQIIKGSPYWVVYEGEMVDEPEEPVVVTPEPSSPPKPKLDLMEKGKAAPKKKAKKKKGK